MEIRKENYLSISLGQWKQMELSKDNWNDLLTERVPTCPARNTI